MNLNDITNKIITKVFKTVLIRKIVGFLFKILVKVLKPNENRVLFGAMNGNWYGDNSRHLFEWVLANRPDLKPVWLTNNRKVKRKLKDQNKPVVLIFSFRGIFIVARARMGFFTDSLRDLFIDPFATHDNIKLIALRHGRSVKRVRFARLGHKISDKEKKERLWESKLIEYAISTSEFVSDIQEECLKIGREKHVVTGYPRNDSVIVPNSKSNNIWQDFLGDLMPEKIILYGPSWRHGRGFTNFFPFEDFDEKKLIETLREEKILLLLRPHVTELEKKDLRYFFDRLAENSDVVKIASHKVFPDVNTLIPYVDALISDYSALYHDFLLLNKPMLFIPYDYEDFAQKNGFLYDYYENLPGPAIESFSELCNNFIEISKGDDKYFEKRESLKNKIHTYLDDKSCLRVSKLIDEIKNK